MKGFVIKGPIPYQLGPLLRNQGSCWWFLGLGPYQPSWAGTAHGGGACSRLHLEKIRLSEKSLKNLILTLRLMILSTWHRN